MRGKTYFIPSFVKRRTLLSPKKDYFYWSVRLHEKVPTIFRRYTDEETETSSLIEALQDAIQLLRKHGLPKRLHTVSTTTVSAAGLPPGVTGSSERDRKRWYAVAVPFEKVKVTRKTFSVKRDVSGSFLPKEDALARQRAIDFRTLMEAGYQSQNEIDTLNLILITSKTIEQLRLLSK